MGTSRRAFVVMSGLALWTAALAPAVLTGPGDAFAAPAGSPAAPVVTAVAKSARATMSWTLPANHGSAITKYVLKTYLGSQLRSTKSVTCAKPCTPARTATISGLTNGKSYTFKVAAVNAKGTGQQGATTIKVSATAIAPGVPKNVHATAGSASATVSWAVPTNGSATITNYVVTPYRAGLQQPAIVVKPSTSRRVTGLTVGQSYTFRVAAKSAAGTGAKSAATAPVVPTEALPSSIDALGDSLTAGWDSCSANQTCPGVSWSTGTSVNSHYQRLLSRNPAINGHAFNEAAPGAPVSSLPGQVNTAISHGAEYVTVLIGGNDVCKQTEGDMTPVATFQSRFESALNTLAAGLPSAKILVVSIPDLYSTYLLGKDNPAATAAWSSPTFVCKSMFANPTSTDQADIDRRANVRQRIIDDNAALAAECAEHANCKYDNDALFDHQWTANEIATVDYLHLSVAGQEAVAELTNTAGYDW